MRIILPGTFVASRWKNGGGVTHEIARAEAPDGRWLWRLSVAEVAEDGPFSAFEGLARILTVIEGAGIDLHTPQGVIAALPLRPVAFAGDLPVTGRLKAGPLRDLNVIYDPARVRAGVERLDGPMDLAAAGEAGFLVLGGEVAAEGQGVPPGACVLGRDVRLTLAAGALGLMVRLAPVTAPPAGR